MAPKPDRTDVVYDFTLTSRTPLLVNGMTEETLNELLTGNRRQKNKDEDPAITAKAKLYVNEAGQICIPAQNIFACLREAGRKVQYKGKTMISNAKGTLLPAFLTIEGMSFPVEVPDGTSDGGWKVDKRRGVLQPAGTAVCIVRPLFNAWSITVRVTIDETEIDFSKIRELFKIAGKMVGLCDFRPQKGGQFGQFTITDVVEVSAAKPARKQQAA